MRARTNRWSSARSMAQIKKGYRRIMGTLHRHVTERPGPTVCMLTAWQEASRGACKQSFAELGSYCWIRKVEANVLGYPRCGYYVSCHWNNASKGCSKEPSTYEGRLGKPNSIALISVSVCPAVCRAPGNPKKEGIKHSRNPCKISWSEVELTKDWWLSHLRSPIKAGGKIYPRYVQILATNLSPNSTFTNLSISISPSVLQVFVVYEEICSIVWADSLCSNKV